MKFTFGSDPEFMLTKKGEYFSAIGIVDGTKDKRIEKDGNQFYYDNVLAECAIKPSKSKEETIENFRQCFKTFAKLVKPYKLEIQASHYYPKEELKHKDARKVGCKIEYCAYLVAEVETKKSIITRTNFRTAGGHIHLGMEKGLLQSDLGKLFTTRMLDLFLGIPSLFLDQDITSSARRRIYGQAGRHRRPPHGLEYRTIGNFWLASPKLVELIYDLCNFTLDFVNDKRYFELWSLDDNWACRPDWANAHHCNGYNLKELRKAIDKSDLPVAGKFRDLLKKHLPSNLYLQIPEELSYTKTDFYKEWRL